MAITSNCAEIIITNPQGSVSFNKLITTTELSPAKTIYSEDRVYLIQDSENVPQTFWWNLEKAIADGYADLEELYDYFVAEIANQCGGGGDTFPNGVVEVSVTRDLQASDKGKLLVVTTSDVVLTMPETAPFNELDKVMIQPNINTSVQPKHNSHIIKLLAINDQVAYSFPKVTFIYQDALGLMPINGVVNKVDGEYADEMIKYLYERDNVAPLNYLLDENGDPILDENGNPIINEN